MSGYNPLVDLTKFSDEELQNRLNELYKRHSQARFYSGDVGTQVSNLIQIYLNELSIRANNRIQKEMEENPNLHAIFKSINIG